MTTETVQASEAAGQELADELLACNSIYPSVIESLNATSQNSYVLTVPRHEQTRVVLSITPDYPQSARPTVISAHGVAKSLVEEVLARQPSGEVCLYGVIEELVQALDDNASDDDDTLEQNTEDISVAQAASADNEIPAWAVSEPIVDHKSVFIGRALHVESVEQVKHALQMLYLDKKIQKATHNMYAYQITRDDNVTLQDNDDDGENAAGSRMAHLLQLMNVTNVLVVVSRWYGGVLLGPDRFKHINSAAREAILRIPQQDTEVTQTKKSKDRRRK